MINIKIWHAKNPTFKCPDTLPSDLNTDYLLVSEVLTAKDKIAAALQFAFTCSQNDETPWRSNTRSTSVGDLLMVMDPISNVGIEVHAVDSVGFKCLFNNTI